MVAGSGTSGRKVQGQQSIGTSAVAGTFPLVSILTPSFNREDLVAETLESICAQTWPHWENIVVDDGSTDRTREIVARYAARDRRIKLFNRKGEPKGACTCRNEGVRLSSGKYVMFLDTDDLIEPFCLEQRVAVMEARPELDFAIFPSYLFEKAPHDLGLLWNIDKPDDPLSRLFRQDGLCQGTGVLWRKESFERIGMWDESLAIWQDVDLFFRAFIQGYQYGKFFDLKPDLHNRVNSASLSRAGYHSIAKAQSRAAVIRGAVDRLKANGMADRVREARFMAGEVVLGAFRARHVELAADMLQWARAEGVVSPTDALALRLFGLLHGVGLGRFRQTARLLAPLEDRFSTDSTLGLISSGPPDVRKAREPTGPSTSDSVSVVIPTKNDAAGLRRCLEGIFRQTVRPHEVIVIDSGSTDGTAEVARGFEGVRVIEIDPESFNHGATRNMGAALATGQFVLFTVQDAHAADEFWIERLLAGFTDEDVAAVCGAQVVPEGPNTNPVVWFRPQTCPKLQIVRFSSPDEFIRLPPADKKKVCGWDDVTALYRLDILRRIRFREAVYGEDVWFAADAYAHGYALAFNPAARVFHYHTENREIAFRRTLASSLARYGALGWMPDRLRILPELLRTIRILAVRSEVPFSRQVFWLAYNLQILLGMQRGIDQFLRAVAAGPEAIVDLQRRYCGVAPSPLSGHVLAVRNVIRRDRSVKKDCRCWPN